MPTRLLKTSESDASYRHAKTAPFRKQATLNGRLGLAHNDAVLCAQHSYREVSAVQHKRSFTAVMTMTLQHLLRSVWPTLRRLAPSNAPDLDSRGAILL
jgi:hypothetical protein